MLICVQPNALVYFLTLLKEKEKNDTWQVFDFENTKMVHVTEQIKELDSV